MCRRRKQRRQPYISNLFLDGAPSAEALRALYGVRFGRLKTSVLPCRSRLGRLHLSASRKKRAVQQLGQTHAWRRVYMSRKKTAHCVLLATAVLLQFDTYDRPSELLGLKRFMLIPPAANELGHASKWTITFVLICATARSKTRRQDYTVAVRVNASGRARLTCVARALFWGSAHRPQDLFFPSRFSRIRSGHARSHDAAQTQHSSAASPSASFRKQRCKRVDAGKVERVWRRTKPWSRDFRELHRLTPSQRAHARSEGPKLLARGSAKCKLSFWFFVCRHLECQCQLVFPFVSRCWLRDRVAAVE